MTTTIVHLEMHFIFHPKHMRKHTQVYIEYWVEVLNIYNRVSAHFNTYFYFFFY